MDKTSRQLAKEIQTTLSIEVSFDEILKQVKVLKSAGKTPAEIRSRVPQILRLHHIKNNKEELEKIKEKVDENETVTGIRIDELPDKYDRNDWR